MKPKTGAELDTLVVESPDEERLAKDDGLAIGAWVRGLASFFTTAVALEQSALAMREEARTLQAAGVPTTAEADLAVQRFVKRTTDGRKALEEHWGICGVVYRFHRRLTARRDVGAKAYDQANTIGNALHAQYVEAERRRVAEIERRQREDAEARARQEREAELARLEADAVAREEGAPDLSRREVVFVDSYVRYEHGQRAASAAGFSNPVASAARLLSLPKIQAAIKAQREAAALRQQAAAKAAEPVTIAPVTVAPEIQRDPGRGERTTWAGELLDEAALMTAFLGCRPADFTNKYGIPADLFMVDGVRLNEYARQLHENLDRWPGVRAKKTTKVV